LDWLGPGAGTYLSGLLRDKTVGTNLSVKHLPNLHSLIVMKPGQSLRGWKIE